MFESDQYRAARSRAAIATRSERALIGLQGADRISFLHSLLSNDVEHLGICTGCSAALLTPQGRMISDMVVLNTGADVLLDVPRATHAKLLTRLDRSIFAEDVRVVDHGERISIGIYGPHAISMVSGALAATGARASDNDSAPVEPMGTWREYQHRQYILNGTPIVVARDNELGLPGYFLWLDPVNTDTVHAAFRTFGAPELSDETADTLRIETGRPRWGADMDEETIPLEAGIEDRAISFTKGCYVGQEVIVRILHRGHGRVARRLVGLSVSAEIPLSRGDTIQSRDKDVGRVTSAALSPLAGSIALGYVQRDFVAPGTPLSIVRDGPQLSAVVTELPFVQP